METAIRRPITRRIAQLLVQELLPTRRASPLQIPPRTVAWLAAPCCVEKHRLATRIPIPPRTQPQCDRTTDL